MPVIQVQMIEGRTVEQKERLIAELTRVTCDVLNTGPETVRIIIQNVAREDWGIGGLPVTRIPGK